MNEWSNRVQYYIQQLDLTVSVLENYHQQKILYYGNSVFLQNI